jgi:hypothetical protein
MLSSRQDAAAFCGKITYYQLQSGACGEEEEREKEENEKLARSQ